MRTRDPKEPARRSQPSNHFAETAVGVVVLLSLQFLSLPILVGGLAVIGIVKLFAKSRTPDTN